MVRRIDGTTKWFMLTVAAIFDLIQVLPFIVMLLGVGIAGLTSWIPIAGWLIGGASIVVTNLMAEAFGFLVVAIAYPTLWLWFKMRGVSLFDGRSVVAKALLLPATLLVELIPFASTLIPSITFWTWRMITITELEDKIAHATLMKQAAADEARALARARAEEERMTALRLEVAERQAVREAPEEIPQ